MSETVAIDKWLYYTLRGDSQLLAAAPGDVHVDAAPRGSTFPLVIMSLQDAQDSMGVNGVRILVKATYLITAIGPGASYSALETAVNRIDALLHRSSGTITGGVIYSCVRLEPIRYREDLDGVEYRHLGGLYEIWVQ